jgi:STE24 endopeptidase
VNEDKAIRYHRLKRRCGVFSMAASAFMLAGLLASGASSGLRVIAERLAHDPPGQFSFMSTALYVVLLAAVLETIELPLAFYRSFLLEQRYGLSSEPAGTWVRDHAKAVALTIVLGVAGTEVVYVAMRWWPAWWWLGSAAVFAVAMGGLANIAPVLLLPIFYRVTPLDHESLRARLVSLSRRAGVPVLGVYEWGLGEKTRRANAALVGTGATRRIIVSDTLLAEYSEDEIEVILAHELAHHVHRDILRGLLVESALLLVAFGTAAAALGALWLEMGLRSPADIAGLPLLLLAAGGTTAAATPGVHALSRRTERRADRYALSLTRQPGAFISAMRRLAAQNLAEERPSRAVLWLFHTHPPIEQRIDAAKAFRI